LLLTPKAPIGATLLILLFVVASGSRVELHLHLDGTVNASLLFELATMRNLSLPGVGVPSDVSDVDRLVKKSSAFERFDVINNIMGGDPRAAYVVGKRIAERQASWNVSYTEIRYDPRRMAQSRYDNSTVPMDAIVRSMSQGLRDGSLENKISVFSILVAMRGQSTEKCVEIAELAARMRDEDEKENRTSLGGVVGIDLAGDEGSFNNSAYVDCFKFAKNSLVLNTTVHAGELGSSSSRLEDVRTAVQEMKVDRIGHGYAATASDEVMQMIRDAGVHLEACPGTALAEGSLDAIRAFQRHNLSFGLNEDDPSPYFGGCDIGCIEAVAGGCKGPGLKVSFDAEALCLARRFEGKGGAGLSVSDIEMAYAMARGAVFAKGPQFY